VITEMLKRNSTIPPRLTVDGIIMGARLFKLEQFVLLCIAVGTSSDKRVINFCKKYSKQSDRGRMHDGKFNTWYFNDGDHDFDQINAKETFHHFPVKHNPIYAWSTKPFLPIVNELEHMILTAERHGYLAFGCDGNKHRGPSVFAMFLCLAGIPPKEATKAANEFFGSNFVMFFVRKRIAKLGWEHGNKNPELRKRLRILMGLR
jgi:hypothetical protein